MPAPVAAAGRNAPCPCGSGKKTKRCHGADAAPSSLPAVAPRPDVEPLVLEAEALFGRQRYGAAVDRARAALAIEPDHVRALCVVGGVAHLARQAETAAEAFLAAIAAAPADPTPRRRLAAVLTDLGLLGDALDQLERAIALTPAGRTLELEAERAAILRRLSRIGEARTIAKRVVIADPSAATARGVLVQLDLAEGRHAEAAAGYRFLGAIAGDSTEDLVVAGPVRGVEETAHAAGDPVTVVAAPRPIAIARPRYAGDATAPEPAIVECPATAVAILRDAVAIGGEALRVAADGTIASDHAASPRADRYDLVRGSLRALEGGHALVHARASGRTIPEAVDLLGQASHNYYHWLLDHLTRFRPLEAAPETAGWPLLVDAAAAAVPQLMEALARVAAPDRAVIVVEPREAIRVGRLAVPSPGVWLPLDVRDGRMLGPEDSIFDPAAIEFVRARLAPGPDARAAAATPRRRLHLARSKAGRLQNAAELRPVLAAFGFEDVLTESLSFADQVGLAAEADVILAENGAALTNLQLAPRSARIVVLGADRWDLTLFSQLAGALGQELTYIAGTPIPRSHPKLYQARFTVERGTLAAALPRILAESAR
jgi:capsular polysaccharide biosynthesis protein